MAGPKNASQLELTGGPDKGPDGAASAKVVAMVPGVGEQPVTEGDITEASRTAAIGVAFAMRAMAAGGKIETETALDMLRNAGLIEDEPEPPPFNWSGWENRAVILPDQFAVAVYINPEGSAVIRQHNPDLDNPGDGGEDACVIIQHRNLPEIIAALQAIAAAPRRWNPPT